MTAETVGAAVLETGAASRLLSPDEVGQGRQTLGRLLDGLGKAILGQPDLLRLVTICILARGHMLL